MLKIHAYFDSMADAGKALNQLNGKGFTSAYLDMSGRYDFEYSKELSIGGPGNSSGMSAVVAKYGGYLLDTSKASLAAAGTPISGHIHLEDSKNLCVKLTVNAEDAKEAEIQKIITENEGRIFPTFIE